MIDLFNPLIEAAYEQASDDLLGTKNELGPGFILLKADGSCEVKLVAWENDAAKKEQVVKVCLLITGSELPVVAYAFFSECWTAHHGPGEEGPFIRPMLDPKRRESVICLVSNGFSQKMVTWQMGRDSRGRCMSLTRQPDVPGASFESWITKSLDAALLMRTLGQVI